MGKPLLDDLKLLHERDISDALGTVSRQYRQLELTFEVEQDRLDVDTIVYAGMGSSALAAELTRNWFGQRVPFEIVRDYDIPAYVSERTYFVAASY